jgi:hypothetical protein
MLHSDPEKGVAGMSALRYDPDIDRGNKSEQHERSSQEEKRPVEFYKALKYDKEKAGDDEQ